MKLDDKKLTFADVGRVEFLFRLHRREAANLGRLSTPAKTAADRYQRNGQLRTESTLFSLAEAEYFDYHLNMKTFGNGLNLKNIYSHGTRPVGADADDQIYRHHYLIGLKLFILIIIKINDELDQTSPLIPSSSES